MRLRVPAEKAEMPCMVAEATPCRLLELSRPLVSSKRYGGEGSRFTFTFVL